MPNIVTSFDHLANLEKYSHEKPYLALLPPADDFDPRKDRRDNLEFKTHTGIVVHDIRHSITSYRVEDCGFEVFHHQTNFPILEDELALKHYQDETAGFLENFFNAVHVTCYDIRLRRNVSMPRETFDFNDKMLLEGPARGAHIDVTMNSGPEIIDRYLSPIEKDLYLRPGYRIQIFNTWRSLLDEVEDRPLGLCDFRSVDPQDLIAADRVLPHRVGEVYYLRFNPNQRWHWLERQRSDEPFLFVMYDTAPGSQARYCPHVSFANPNAPDNAPPRESVETRSIVITKI